VPPATTSTAEGIRFALVDADAQSVAVAGTFNGWSITAHPLGRDRAGGVWTTTVVLPPGEHHFMFVVDGVVWVTPPSADAYVDDGFGSHNGVVIVGPGES